MGPCVSKYEPDPGFLFFSQSGLFGGLFSFCIVCMDDLLRRWGRTMLEMDGKLVFETTAEMDGKPDTWTTQAMYEQQGPQSTQVMEAGPGS